MELKELMTWHNAAIGLIGAGLVYCVSVVLFVLGSGLQAAMQ